MFSMTFILRKRMRIKEKRADGKFMVRDSWLTVHDYDEGGKVAYDEGLP